MRFWIENRNERSNARSSKLNNTFHWIQEFYMTTDVVIVAATRTAVGKFGGTLSKTPAPELGAAVVVELLRRSRLNGAQIDELIFGQVLTGGSGQNPARQTVI